MSITKPSTLESQLVTVARLQAITSFIAERTKFKGDFEADEATDGQEVGIKIDGSLEGSINIPNGGVVHIGPTGHVKGAAIVADYVFIEGTCESKIVARLGVEVTGSAIVRGEIEYHGSYNQHNLAKVRASVTYAGPDDGV
jgi:cytoskeletal protein CcmA (bactofilin family)